jgi:hypothetical protein
MWNIFNLIGKYLVAECFYEDNGQIFDFLGFYKT